MISYDIVIVGGGPAGLAAAASAKEAGTDSILIIERDRELGGILNQCIHNGFGLHTFKEELTGPEYANRFIEKVLGLGIEYRLDTMVMDISADKVVTAMNRADGMFQIKAKAVILAMGCRERPRGALNIPGYRPAGIYSAGTAQRLVNMEGYMPGREVVILGSGDIGLIMARRMTFEGAIVKVVAELMPFSGGLKRNIVQCLDDYGIPLKLSHTVIDIEGKERVSAVTIAKVGPDMPVTSGPAVNEILETSIPGVFACGNVLHVHDLVDYVSEESSRAGANAAAYVQNGCRDSKEGTDIKLVATDGARYTVPGTVNISRMDDNLTVRFRVGAVFKDSYVSVYFDDERVQHRKKRIMAPGEMEQVILQKKKLLEYPGLSTITIRIEAE